MKIVNPSFRWLGGVEPNGQQMLKNIAEAARICYQSRRQDGEARLVSDCIARGHESVIEHEKVSVVITCDRGVSHELVRHRVASYSQESTRYCNYSKGAFGNEITVICPWWADENMTDDRLYQFGAWKEACEVAECNYFAMLKNGAKPEAARAVLPNSLKTEIAVTMNLREWRHFFKLRALGTTGAPHPDIQRIAEMMLLEFADLVPVVFDDLVTRR